MDKQKEYFISLISSFLNEASPETDPKADWNEIYRLSAIHNVTAIIANQISLLPDSAKPDEELMKAFRQQLGYTIISYENKCNIISSLRKTFNDNKIPFIFVKGAVLKEYYPISELRTSADIDVFIKFEDYERAKALFMNDEYKITTNSSRDFAFFIGDDYIELHTDKDYDNEFFSDIFNIADKNGYEYSLNNEYHLLYVLCHIAKHFNYCGAGIKMFCDVDVLIRKTDNFDYGRFLLLCEEAGIAHFAKAVFSLCNYIFNTPVKAEIDFNKEKDMLNLFENAIIDGGSYGFEKRSLGEYYINKSLKENSKNTFLTKIKAILIFIFPKADYLKKVYPYCFKHPVLLPFAWIQRIFDGMFKRAGHSKKTLSGILNSNDYSEEYKKLLNELKI